MYINVASNNSASSLSNKISNGEWVVLYYADWCGHCTTMKPEWHKFIKHMKTSRNNINVASVNSDFVGDLKHKPVIDGYPSITMYINGVKVAKFDGERKYKNIHNFAMSNSAMRPNKKRKTLNNVINNAVAVAQTHTRAHNNNLNIDNGNGVDNRVNNSVNTRFDLGINPNLGTDLGVQELQQYTTGNIGNIINNKTLNTNSQKYYNIMKNDKQERRRNNNIIKKIFSKSIHQQSQPQQQLQHLQQPQPQQLQFNNNNDKNKKLDNELIPILTNAIDVEMLPPSYNTITKNINPYSSNHSKPIRHKGHKGHRSHSSHSSHRGHRSHRGHSTKHTRISNTNSNRNVGKLTKRVFGKLIKSFGKISNEAHKDSKLLHNATSKL